MATHIYTSVVVNYLPKARVLAESIRRFHPDWSIHLVLCDMAPEWFSVAEEPFDSLLRLEDLDIPDLRSWIFKHNLVELCTAVKGFALRKILDLPDCTEVFYFDPDIAVFASLAPLVREFQNASVLLTPHSTEPENDPVAVADNEGTMLRHGIFNLGFIGVRSSEEGRRFASWWRDRLHEFCYDDIARGLFTDQRWIDIVPAFFTGYKILRDVGYNVSTWNLTHRTVSGSVPDGLLVNGQPLVFYHFSGFDSGAQLRMLKKYGSAMPALFELREWYTAACDRHGQGQVAQRPWAYGFFDNGEPITDSHRKLYREKPDLPSRFPNPYAAQEEDQPYFHWFASHGKLPFRGEEKHLQLYWRTAGKNFSERNSSVAAPLGVARQTVHLPFPQTKGQKLEALRLDLPSQAGFLWLHQLFLLNSRDEAVWSWAGDPSYWKSAQSHQVCLIDSVKAASGGLLYLTGSDPYLILPIPASLLGEIDFEGSLAVDLTIGAPEDYLPDLVAAVQSSRSSMDLLQNELHSQEEQLAKCSGELTERSLQAESWRLTAERLQNSLSWQATKPLRAMTRLGRKLLKH